jgi:hypothetical protein
MVVKPAFASVYHPQSNRVVKKVNTLIFIAVKKILENQPKGKWAEELLRAVWSRNTSIFRVTKFNPFKLLYGEGPVTLEEIKLRSARTRTEATYSPNEAKLKDLLELECMKAVETSLPELNERMKRYESKAKAHWSWGHGVAMKPTYRSLGKAGT